ncbi:endoplasmic reticulum resident protein 44 [Hyperolius riggenbachi]|uniref:endoplasmic reticulum resident protein 44 n=1 Tax=Hyperolius riggenbachi TaxID=752182 RepID=UPI0035A2F5F0
MRRAIFLPLTEPAYVLLLCVATWVCTPVRGEILNLESSNIDDILGNADVALVNFYADWCRFSQMLHPIFDEASNIIKEEYPDRSKVVFARVDCDQHCTSVGRKKCGRKLCTTTRGDRTLRKIVEKDRFQTLGDLRKQWTESGVETSIENAPDMVYLGSLTNSDLVYAWTQDKCVPLVREITFENGEELTEEGLPFLILFHMKDDHESLEKFQQEVARQLISEKGTINFLHADCDKFRHPLLHIQKSPADCPVIAIDSFRHMYVFPDFKDLSIPGKLKQFVLDLHSGKLHREFHHGPDPTDIAPGQQTLDTSSPPESSFQKLAPSEYRYTILKRDRDEL